MVYMYFFFFSNNNNNNNNNKLLATKDSNQCNLTTSKLHNESANLTKNKHCSYRNITQAAQLLYISMDLFEVGRVL